MSNSFNRRTFILGTAGAAALASRARAQSTDKLRIAMIGVGGQGAYSWQNLVSEDVRVLCDVDTSRCAKAVERFPNAEVVQDFRRVIDRKDIDAVAVATPDHWHAIPSIWAMESGKHVYCEKPLAHSVHEVRAMINAAKTHNRVTQMGTQIHAGSNYRRVVELVQSGAIGPVKKVDVWCNRRPDPGRVNVKSLPPPTLDYDMWVGPAPWREYDPTVLPFNWRWWWEFGGGVLADMGCHYMDLAHWALNLRHPDKVAATGTEFPDAPNKVPVEMRVVYHYAARSGQPPVELVWWHGNPGPKDADGNVMQLGLGSAVLFTGEKGQLLADYNTHKLLPESQFAGFKRPDPFIAESVGHHREWVNAIKNGGATTCNFEYSGALTETVLLGNVAYRLGKEIAWDSKAMKITNVPESEWKPLIRRAYRGDWKLHKG